MACADSKALDLFAVSNVINVRLLQVLAFGRKAATASPPFNLKNRKSYHITKWVATAHWHADEEVKKHCPDDAIDGHGNFRWRSQLTGEFRRESDARMSYSFAEPGMAVMVRRLSGNGRLTYQCRFTVLRVLVSIPCTGFLPNKQPRQSTVLWQDFALRITAMKVIVGTLHSHWRTGAIP